jgi:hypothetical protein
MATDALGDFTNSILICVDCGEEFVFTASAQKYFAERGFTDPPKRCKACYNEYRNRPHPIEGESPAESPGGAVPPAPDATGPVAGERP